MERAYYSDSISDFLTRSHDQILGEMVRSHGFDISENQRDAWINQIIFLKKELSSIKGNIYFEFSIPRMGKRVDVLLLIESYIFILEFKVGSRKYFGADIDQVTDYALDLSNFHEASHHACIVPLLIATEADDNFFKVTAPDSEGVFPTICTNGKNLKVLIADLLNKRLGEKIDPILWNSSGYRPTPTIIEATLALYSGHSVDEISRSDAGARNLTVTSASLIDIIEKSRRDKEKSVVFVTGVPGSGKTLVGLNIATKFIDKEAELYSVFLSGNGPLVKILQEALARDKSQKSGERIGRARSEVKAFIQNVHHLEMKDFLI
jgi:hypothetical protein